MSLVGKLQAEILITAPAHKFHEMFWHKPHHISTISPEKIQKVVLHEGHWGKTGSVIQWSYAIDGKERACKQIIEEDEETKSLIYTTIDGEITKEYKSSKFILQTVSKGDTTLVHWTLEYEKLDKNIRAPPKEFALVIQMTEDIEDYLVQT